MSLDVNDFAAFVAFAKYRVTLNNAEWHRELCPQCALRILRGRVGSSVCLGASALILFELFSADYLYARGLSWASALITSISLREVICLQER